MWKSYKGPNELARVTFEGLCDLNYPICSRLCHDLLMSTRLCTIGLDLVIDCRNLCAAQNV